jgi:hypothetical protein
MPPSLSLLGKAAQLVDDKTSIKVVTSQAQLEDLYYQADVIISKVVLFTPQVAEVHYKATHGFAKPNMKASPILNCYTTARARIEMHGHFISLSNRGYQIFYT